MTTPLPDTRHPFARSLRRRPTVGALAGYLVFTAGTLLDIWLARQPQSDGNNPALVLLLVWMIAGVTHIFVRAFWRACVISAFGSVLGYVLLVVAFFSHEVGNEMFAAGMIDVGLFGFVLSMVMGVPVVMYRRIRRTSQESVG